MRAGADVGPELGRETVEGFDTEGLEAATFWLVRETLAVALLGRAGAALDVAPDVEPGRGALEGAVREGAFRLLDVGRAEPEGEVRAGAVRLLDVGRFAIVALLAADCSRSDIPALGGLSEPTPTGWVIPTSAPTGPAARKAPRANVPATPAARDPKEGETGRGAGVFAAGAVPRALVGTFLFAGVDSAVR